jgi:hypothetical protein
MKSSAWARVPCNRWELSCISCHDMKCCWNCLPHLALMAVSQSTRNASVLWTCLSSEQSSEVRATRELYSVDNPKNHLQYSRVPRVSYVAAHTHPNDQIRE